MVISEASLKFWAGRWGESWCCVSLLESSLQPCPCHLPGRHPLPQLLLLGGFILQNEPQEPGTWAKNSPLEGSQAACSALELVLVSGRALGWAVAAGHTGTPHGMPRRVAGERKGGIAPCLSLAPIFTLRSKWLEVSPGLVPPTSPKSGRNQISHLLCTFQAGMIISSSCNCFLQYSSYQSGFLWRGMSESSSELSQKPFPSLSRILAALRCDPFTSRGFFFFFLLSFCCLALTLHRGVKSEAIYRTSPSPGIKKRKKAMKHE